MRDSIRRANRDENGQMAFFMLLMLMVVAVFFALGLDAGFWYFDHRRAQNQAEAAALAGAQKLPLELPALAANDDADTWLMRNGSGPAERYAAGEQGTLTDSNDDDKADTLRVCVRRESGIFFSSLADITNVMISACATAKAGPVDGTNVMPWGVVAPDPGCDSEATRNCVYDANGNGSYSDPGDCNAPYELCPFGLTEDRLYTFKQDGSGGNLGMLRVCGSGVNNYRQCLSGAASSGFFEVDDTVESGVQPGTSPNATQDLENRLPAGAWDLPAASVCDVNSRPNTFGYDPAGKASAISKFVNPTSNPQCEYRLVAVPIIDELPPTGFENVTVLGVASFGVANWKRTSGNSAASNYFGTPTEGCRTYSGAPPSGAFPCGDAWGYLFTGVTPPDILLESIGETNNPFAPILIALVD